MNDTTFNAELAELADQIDLSGLGGFCVDRRNFPTRFLVLALRSKER
jgi:hypothetical protein